MYYSDRSEGDKRWLVDSSEWYTTKKNENGNTGYIWALSTADFPATGPGWTWHCVYGGVPTVEILSEFKGTYMLMLQ